MNLSVSDRLHAAAAPIWEKCLRHPFVTGIGDGTLDVEKFRFFMLQDYLYLFDYAKVFALGVVKARDPRLMRLFARNVDAVLGGEMNIHRAYMKRLGITEEQVLAVQPALDNLSYTHYMLSVASAGTPMEIIASILACSWSYAEIGKDTLEIADHPFFGEWVEGYACDEYHAANVELCDLMDSMTIDETRYPHIEEIFLNCSLYELAFWQMSWEMRL